MSSKKSTKGIPFSKVKVGEYFSPVSRPDVVCQKIKYHSHGKGCCKIAHNAVIVKHPTKRVIGFGDYVMYNQRVVIVPKRWNYKNCA